MGRSSVSNRLDRLDQLLGCLKSGDFFTAKDLAEQVGVSQRTLMRDLAVLRQKGYPVEADQGRGGGIRLYAQYGIGRITLNYREVIDVLLATYLLEKMQTGLFFNHLSSLRQKLYATFPQAERDNIRQVRHRLLVGGAASVAITENYTLSAESSFADDILSAFFNQRCLTIDYEREDGRHSQRTVEIHYMLIYWPAWYLICFDHLRGAARVFRLDRIKGAIVLLDKFILKDKDSFKTELAEFDALI